MRLSQYLSVAGVCSKRTASRRIRAGDVLVNGVVADNHTVITGDERIIVDGQAILLPENYTYVVYNKPVGVDCNCRPNDPASIVNHLVLPKRLFPVGRLDKDSHGLLLLTDNGGLCHRLLSTDAHYRKTYRVSVRPHYQRPDIGSAFRDHMQQGIELDGLRTLPCELVMIGVNQFVITLRQGLHRQIRRMSRVLGYHVTDLQRISIGDVELEGLALGDWRYLKGDIFADCTAGSINTVPL